MEAAAGARGLSLEALEPMCIIGQSDHQKPKNPTGKGSENGDTSPGSRNTSLETWFLKLMTG